MTGTIYYFVYKFIANLKEILFKKNKTARISEEVTNLDPLVIPKFVNQLVKPPVYKPFVLKEKVVINEKTLEGKEEKQKKKIKKTFVFHRY